jgi:hypothetical protein
MLTAAELSAGVYGAWRLAHLDSKGHTYFDRSIEGFWKSFWAAAVVLPGYIILLALQLSETEVTASAGRLVIVEAISYIIGWTAFPLAVFYIAPVIDRQEQYLGYIVAHNWAEVVQIGLLLPVTIVAALGILPSAITLFAMLAILYYEWFIAKTALAVDGLVAFGIVVLNLMIGITLTAVTNGMIS